MNGGYIETFTVNHSDEDYPINYRLFDEDNAWINKDQRPAVDAHYYAGKVYDYYKMSIIVTVLMGKVKQFALL